MNEEEKESHLLASAYESRIITTTKNALTQIDIEFRCGKILIILKTI